MAVDDLESYRKQAKALLELAKTERKTARYEKTIDGVDYRANVTVYANGTTFVRFWRAVVCEAISNHWREVPTYHRNVCQMLEKAFAKEIANSPRP
ncbi:hypothetical protein DU99_01380 [Sinorhizobium meliloti]|nr:hypothetical protein DU99_01380 [Sinorhizobium meliloti]